MPERLWAPWRLEYIEHVDDERPACFLCIPEEPLLVHRGTHAFVILNRYPYASGHLMVVPVRHTGVFGELTDDEALEVHQLAASAVDALTATYAPQGHNLGWNLGRAAGAGLVEHLHLHVVPRWVGDTNFMPVLGDVRVLPEALDETARRLRAAWPVTERTA